MDGYVLNEDDIIYRIVRLRSGGSCVDCDAAVREFTDFWAELRQPGGRAVYL